MNILLYVTVTIMLLSMLTYAKLDSYRSFSGLKAGFTTYMQKLEREPINVAAEDWYHSIHPGTKQAAGDKNPKAEGTARISFHLILNKEAREKNPEGYQQTSTLTKKLFQEIYGQEKFFLELAERRPNFVNEILNEIQMAADNLSDRSILVNANAEILETITLSSPELQTAYYYMLKGIQKLKMQKPSDAQDTLEDMEDTTDAENESNQAHAEAGYLSFLDFVTLKATPKIRIYLAPPQVLMAIYEDSHFVEKILQTRKELFKQVNAGGNLQEASQQFEDAFKHTGQASNYADILNFAVTKTNPAKYE